jgi:Protein kinase domain/PEGA domain/Tetratricopeptide repeat
MVPRRALLVLLIVPVLASAAPAHAQEWHEAYRNGVRALAQGQPERAVSLLEYAASQRPQPGRDVVTYGTNVERQYYPYLKLAEAYLQLHDLAGARTALKRSETWAREPPEDRRRLAAQVEALAARAAAPPSAAPAATPPPPHAPATEPAAASAPPATPVPAASASAAAPLPAPAVTSPPRAEPVPEPRSAPSSGRALPGAAERGASPRADVASGTATTGVLEVVSQPPAASVYLDDELVGSTDPEWGRLVRTGIAPGRHRVRITAAGHRDLTEEVDVPGGGRTELRRRLDPASAPARDARLVLFAAVALVLLALTAWALRRPAAAAGTASATPAPVSAPTPGSPRFDASAPTPPRPTPTGLGSRGVHRAADGHDYFGEYRLVAPLGRGGMASVYRAERGGEVSALKRPLGAFLEEPEFLERFLREAEIGRTLHHPNIVRILERGEVEGVPFFTMELVPGETLQALLQRGGAMAPRAATQIVVQIAEALDYAHLKGVVHRDLKPSNVMVIPDGTARVMDYGIARARRFEGLTVTGSFLGSPEYVAPETIESGGADARSDLYSLGVIFYETLTGTRPFLADTPFAILRKHLTETPAPPSSVRPGVPAELERIVLRLLSKTPEGRYAAAEDVVLDLRDFLNRAA